MRDNLIKSILLSFIIMISPNIIGAQSIGVRAGLNYSKISGPMELGETTGILNGFHFGLNYGYLITDKFSTRVEILYNQIGTNHKYHGEGYFKVYQSNQPTGYMTGILESNIDVSNAYINIPFTANYQLHPKFEVYGGLSFNFLINPVGRGAMRFQPSGKPDQAFRQSYDYNYYKDDALQATFSAGNTRPVAIIYEEDIVNIPRFVGAYYQHEEKRGGLFNWFDISTLAGINYYINRGFFAGARLSYGLLDATNGKMDRSLRELNEDDSFKFRKDYDHNVNLELSIGFKF